MAILSLAGAALRHPQSKVDKEVFEHDEPGYLAVRRKRCEAAHERGDATFRHGSVAWVDLHIDLIAEDSQFIEPALLGFQFAAHFRMRCVELDSLPPARIAVLAD